MADTATRYPYTQRELDRTAKELERMLTRALYLLTNRRPQ